MVRQGIQGDELNRKVAEKFPDPWFSFQPHFAMSILGKVEIVTLTFEAYFLILGRAK